MSIKLKIMLLIIVPIIGLVFVSSKALMTDYINKSSLEELSIGINLSTKLSKLLHETQKERGMTAGFLASNGVNFKYKLKSQRELVNQRTEELKFFLKKSNLLQNNEKLANLISKSASKKLNSPVLSMTFIKEQNKKQELIMKTTMDAFNKLMDNIDKKV